MIQVARPALRYYGGKWRDAQRIIAHFPAHVCYCEPFGGGASVLLNKIPSHLEVYNDRDEVVVNFFRVLREQPETLIRAIELTPYARSELAQAYEPSEDPVEEARRFYIRSWQGRGGPHGQWKTGWRFQRIHARGKRAVDDWSDTAHLWAVVERLKQVQIENGEALKIIERYDAPTTLFYLDPPYLPETRSERWGQAAYFYEMTHEDHIALGERLKQIQGMAVISGYSSPLYCEMFSGWRRVTWSTLTDAATQATECLWISPAAEARGQMRLRTGTRRRWTWTARGGNRGRVVSRVVLLRWDVVVEPGSMVSGRFC